jgi:hypothetical protein
VTPEPATAKPAAESKPAVPTGPLRIEFDTHTKGSAEAVRARDAGALVQQMSRQVATDPRVDSIDKKVLEGLFRKAAVAYVQKPRGELCVELPAEDPKE